LQAEVRVLSPHRGKTRARAHKARAHYLWRYETSRGFRAGTRKICRILGGVVQSLYSGFSRFAVALADQSPNRGW